LDLSEFDYSLPPELIAQEPAPRRDGSRMMLLSREAGAVQHGWFRQLPDLLRGDELLVFNDSKVIPARMRGTKATGGRVEVLLLRILSPSLAEAMTRTAKPLRPGTQVRLDQTGQLVTVEEVPTAGRALVRIPGTVNWSDVMEQEGQPPLPPYIQRPMHWADEEDRQRYQTVYARQDGSVAAPTAGLHFSQDTLAALTAKGVETAYVTLHVGPGTFVPVRTPRVEEHVMEAEYYSIPPETVQAIAEARAVGRPVLAVGTTTVRCLESAAGSGELLPGNGCSTLYIYPGYRFRVVDQLLTNFHLPGSTLLLLVAALAGAELTRYAYSCAVSERYRFYSYGDCMLIR
jgi:S-adenosylmethionine:tRNA ribosyltransferase-isomerase